MNPCIHREHTLTHGSFLAHSSGVLAKRFVPPSFAWCSTSLHADIRTVTLAQSSDFANDEDIVPWEERNDERLFWRGSTTGMWHSARDEGDGESWRGSQRVRLVNWTSADAPMYAIRSGTSSSLVEYLDPSGAEKGRVGEPKRIARRKLNRAIMDVAFGGSPIQCEASSVASLPSGPEPRDVCALMASSLAFTGMVEKGRNGAGKYKYLLDVDGNGWSARFRRLLSQDAVVFKNTLYPEWYLDRVEPWVHYVPVKVDYEDLHDILVRSFAWIMTFPPFFVLLN